MKVVLALVPLSRIGEILCNACMEGLKWPKYAWILTDFEVINNDITSSSTDCKAFMYQVLEKVFVISYKLEPVIAATRVNLNVAHPIETYLSHSLLSTNNSIESKNGTTNFYANVLLDSMGYSI